MIVFYNCVSMEHAIEIVEPNAHKADFAHIRSLKVIRSVLLNLTTVHHIYVLELLKLLLN